MTARDDLIAEAAEAGHAVVCDCDYETPGQLEFMHPQFLKFAAAAVNVVLSHLIDAVDGMGGPEAPPWNLAYVRGSNARKRAVLNVLQGYQDGQP